MRVILKEENLVITFKYDPVLVFFIKSFDGRKFNASTKEWSLPLACVTSDTLRRLSNRGFFIDGVVYGVVKAQEDRVRELEALAVMDNTEFVTPLPLFPYQKVGAAFLYRLGSGILGDSPGLGKTVQSLAVAVKAEAQKVLIFTPSAVKWQFASEIERFIPGVSVVVLEGNQKERAKLWQGDYRFYIANYELLLRDFEFMDSFEWDLIIADEATKLSNPMAKQSKAIKKLRAKRKIAMTGTPISNRAQDCYNLVDFVAPGALGSFWSFTNQYCLKNQFGGIYGYQNLDELRVKLGRYMIRRLKQDVLPELPEKIETDVPFELSLEEKELYKKIKKEILFEISAKDISKIESPMTIQNTIVKMIRLRQLADSMELLGENKKSSKVEVLKELLTQILD